MVSDNTFLSDVTHTLIHHHFLRIAYDGTNFRGWQRQPNELTTVQQGLEALLSRVHRRQVSLGGCGRTDAGVHATQFYAYLRTEDPLPDNYLFIVNKQLPAGIRILGVHPVPDNAQARYDATERTYDYFLHTYPDPFLDSYSSRLDLPDFAPAAAAELLTELPDHQQYRAFCKTPDRHNTTIVHFREAAFFRSPDGSRYRIRFTANRFLRGMIRLLVNDLLLVGQGKLTAAGFRKMLVTGERAPHFRLAPPEGLFLTGVRYPYIDRGPDLPVTGRGEWREIQ